MTACSIFRCSISARVPHATSPARCATCSRKPCASVAPLAAERRTTILAAPVREYDVAIGRDRLAQTVINILENAIKHGRDAGRIALSVAELDERYIEIRVDDDGPGVASGERDAIFALAKRGANATSPGTGIGLAVVRLMIERIGGEVDVTRSPLGGAQFRVRLPLRHGDPQTAECRQSLKSSTKISPSADGSTAMPTRA